LDDLQRILNRKKNELDRIEADLKIYEVNVKKEKKLLGIQVSEQQVKKSDDEKEVVSPIIQIKRPEKKEIQVGLDFGTSNTKIVFKQYGKNDFRVMNFNHNLKSYPNYCLPSLAAFNLSGELLLGMTQRSIYLIKIGIQGSND